LFQKVYYAKGLLLEDERKLRESYELCRKSYEWNVTANNVVVWGAYVPFTLYVSRQVRPFTVALWTVAWWTMWKSVTLPMQRDLFQKRLNSAAKPLAAKYGL
jgi:hypothetical protein